MKYLVCICASVLVACGGGDDSSNPPASTGRARAAGRVTSAETGSGIAGVTVSSGSVSATTDSEGNYELQDIATASSVLLRFNKTGLVPQGRSTFALADDGASTIVNVPMLAVLVTEQFDPNNDHTIVVPGSTAMVALRGGTLRRADGSSVVGQATAFVTPIAPATNVDLMPGNYLAAQGNGSAAMESFGALDASFVDESGAALNLGSNTTSTIRIAPSSRSNNLPDTMPLFYYDTSSGLWREEGTATRVGFGDDAYYEGTVAHFTTWNCDRVYETVVIRGCVEDANGQRVSGAVVRSEGKNYVGVATAPTDAEGNFAVPAMSNGEMYVLASTADGIQVSNAAQLSTYSQDVTQDTCLRLTQAALSVKLTWGARPSDLDSHTLGANKDEHIYFGSKGDLAQAPYIALDVDDVSGFGPEVTTFSRLARNRTYRYFIYNYSDSFDPGQTGSPARVDVTLAGRSIVFTPPAGETEDTRRWHVFDVTTDGSCEPTIVSRQMFLVDAPVSTNPDTPAEYCD